MLQNKEEISLAVPPSSSPSLRCSPVTLQQGGDPSWLPGCLVTEVTVVPQAKFCSRDIWET